VSDWIIRPGQESDLERVLEILIDGFRGRTVHHWLEQRFGEIGGQSWETWKRAELSRFYEAHPDWLLVAESEGRVVGFVTYTLDPIREVGEIRNNAVDPAFQGRGLGTALYRQVVAIFGQAGMKYAWVETGLEEEYAPARRAYEKAGFEPFHEAVYYIQALEGTEATHQEDSVKPEVIRYDELTPKVFPANRETRVISGAGGLPSKRFATGYVVVQPGGEVPAHGHAQEEVYFVLKGHGQITVDDTVYEVEPLSAVYIPPGARHHLVNTGEAQLKFVFTYAPGGEVDHWAEELAQAPPEDHT
jgi:mannose-6-phosphate isomerase-like protein (cupin superfamily)